MSDDNAIARRRMLAMGSMLGPGLTLSRNASSSVEQLYGDAVRLSDGGAVRRTFGDETAIVQRAIDAAIRTRRPLFLDRAVRVSRLRIEDANGLFVFQTAPIVGMTSGSFGPLITVANSTDITWAGRLWLSCQWNPEYEAALAFVARGRQIASNIAIHDWAISGARTAFRFGEQDAANGLISEITIQNGTSYGCPNVIEAFGHNTVATFNGGNLIANHLGGNGAWNDLSSDAVRVSGAHLTFMGCEVQHNASPDGAAFRLDRQAAATPQESRFGSIAAFGCAIEAAGPLLVARDASGHPASDEGHIFMEGCKGYHSQRSFPFIQLATGFAGRVRIADGCRFRAGAARTAPVARAEGDALLDLSPHVFDANFLASGAMTQGGIALFPRRTIARPVLRPGTQALPDRAGRRTGLPRPMAVFICPHGGLNDVEVGIAITCKTTLPSRAWVMQNDTVIARLPMIADDDVASIAAIVAVGDMAAGARLLVVIDSDDPALAISAQPDPRISISAWR